MRKVSAFVVLFSHFESKINFRAVTLLLYIDIMNVHGDPKK